MLTKKLRILDICNRVVYPPSDGGTISALAAANGLYNEGCDVTIFAINAVKHYVDVESLPDEFAKRFHLLTLKANTDVTTLGAIRNMLSTNSYHTVRFRLPEFRRRLIALLSEQEFDIVHIEGVHMAWYIPDIRKQSSARIILRAPNVEHQLWQTTADSQTNIAKNIYLKVQVQRYKKFEDNALHLVDGVVGVSPDDVKYFEQHVPKDRCHLAPIPADISAFTEQGIEREPNSVFHLGDLAWQQNFSGVEWFLDNVWELVAHKLPQVQFYIAGRNIPANINARLLPNVHSVGEVQSAARFMMSKNIMAVPLLAGGGTRVKIIEGMSAGNLVITTPIGAQGLGAEHNKHLIIANSPKEFAEAIMYCSRNPEFCTQVASNALQFVRKNFDATNIGKAYTNFYHRIAEMPPRVKRY